MQSDALLCKDKEKKALHATKMQVKKTRAVEEKTLLEELKTVTIAMKKKVKGKTASWAQVHLELTSLQEASGCVESITKVTKETKGMETRGTKEKDWEWSHLKKNRVKRTGRKVRKRRYQNAEECNQSSVLLRLLT